MAMDETALIGLAAQLRKPAGEWATKVGEFMNTGNALLNKRAIDALQVQPNDSILEIGMGNGFFVKDILAFHETASYTGYDYSQEMVNEAVKNNTGFVEANRAAFFCGDARKMLFKDAAFNKVLTVNTIYFWDNREEVLAEIARVLLPGGMLVIGIRPEHIMKAYPMTKYGFKMYSSRELQDFLIAGGFSIASVTEADEPQHEIGGMLVDVASLIVCARYGNI